MQISALCCVFKKCLINEELNNGISLGAKEICENLDVNCISFETAINCKTPEPMQEQMQICFSEIAKYFAL